MIGRSEPQPGNPKALSFSLIYLDLYWFIKPLNIRRLVQGPTIPRGASKLPLKYFHFGYCIITKISSLYILLSNTGHEKTEMYQLVTKPNMTDVW